MNRLPEKKRFRPDEVADFFKVTRKTIYSWILKGKLRSVRKENGEMRIELKDIHELMFKTQA